MTAPLRRPVAIAFPPTVRPRDVLPLPALVTGEPDEATRHGWAKAAAASMVQTDRKPAKPARWWPWIALLAVFWTGVLLLAVPDRGSKVQALELRP